MSNRPTESELLSVYQKVNPSTYRIETDDEEYQNRESFFSGLIHERLCFPRKMFKDADLIEFGSGTGEYSLFYQLWGTKGTFVEINDQAIARMEHLFQHFEISNEQYQSVNQSLFDFVPNRTWEIVATIGVLHHLDDKDDAFRRVAECVAPDGFLLFGVGNKSGMFQRHLQRLVVNHFAGQDHDRIEYVVEKLFSEHLQRAERFGRRNRKAIIYDTYVNPKVDSMSVNEVLNLFKCHGLRLYSAWPPVLPGILGDSPNSTIPDFLRLPALLNLVELEWLSHRDEDAENLALIDKKIAPAMKSIRSLVAQVNNQGVNKNVDLINLKNSLNASISELQRFQDIYALLREQSLLLLEEVDTLVSLLETDSIEAVSEHLKGCKMLFKGTAGLGMNYFIGQKTD